MKSGGPACGRASIPVTLEASRRRGGQATGSQRIAVFTELAI